MLAVGLALLDTVRTFDRIPVINKHKHRRAGRRHDRREHIKQKLAKELEGCEFGNIVGGFSQAD